MVDYSAWSIYRMRSKVPKRGLQLQCYVINLDRSPDRLAKIGLEFAKLGLSFIRVPATDGKSLSSEQIASLTPSIQIWDYPLTPSEIGCFLSHRACLERIAHSNDKFGAIFEDDVLLSDNAKPFLENSHWIPAGTDIVKLETHGRVVLVDEITNSGIGNHKIAKLCSTHLCAGGYVISREAARKLLPLMSVAAVPVDNLFFDPVFETARTLRVQQLVPAVCVQSGIDSTISPERSLLRPAKTRKSLGSKLLREITRPVWRTFTRSKYSLSPAKLWVSMTTSRKWLRVPFK